MVREFELVNERGQIFSLMDLNNYCLLTEPTGLGYSYNANYELVGNCFAENIRTLEQGTISGILHFKDYDKYRNFVDYIETSEKLKWKYKLPYKNTVKTFFKDISIKSISKTEKNIVTGLLDETVIFDVLSLWYEEHSVDYEIDQETEAVRWNFKFDTYFREYDSSSIVFENKGHVDAPIFLEIDGYVNNPRILIVDDSGNSIFDITIPVEIQSGEKFVYCSKDNDIYIQKISSTGDITNLFNETYISLLNDNIIKLPKKNVKIQISASSTINKSNLKIFVERKVV